MPPHRTDCSPKRSVSVSSLNVVSRTPARVLPSAAGVGEVRARPVPEGVPLDREQGGHAAAGLVDRADEVAGTLRRDHPDVDGRRRVDPPEPQVEAVGEHQQLAGAQVRRDLGVVDGLLRRVRHEDHDDVGRLDRVGDVGDPQARLLGVGPALRPGRQPDDDVDPALVQVQRVRMPLAAVPDDRDRLPGQGSGSASLS